MTDLHAGDDPNALAKRRALLEANDFIVDKYVEAFEWDAGEDGYHVPTEGERILIGDAIAGLLADDGFVRTFNAWQDEVRGARVPAFIRKIMDEVRAHGHHMNNNEILAMLTVRAV